MAAPREYSVLVDGTCVYSGLYRTADVVFQAVVSALDLVKFPVGYDVPVVLLTVNHERSK
nr:unnamed protein product [uncultured bacterium]